MKYFINRQVLKLSVLIAQLSVISLTFAPCLTAGEPLPEETLAWCEIMAIEAYDMAFNAQVTLDYPMANHALSSTEEAAYHVGRVIRLARDTADQKLAWSAYRVSNQVKAAIAKIVLAARDIAARSSDPKVVHAANFLLESCELVQKENRASMDIALMPIKAASRNAEAYSKE